MSEEVIRTGGPKGQKPSQPMRVARERMGQVKCFGAIGGVGAFIDVVIDGEEISFEFPTTSFAVADHFARSLKASTAIDMDVLIKTVVNRRGRETLREIGDFNVIRAVVDAVKAAEKDGDN